MRKLKLTRPFIEEEVDGQDPMAQGGVYHPLRHVKEKKQPDDLRDFGPNEVDFVIKKGESAKERVLRLLRQGTYSTVRFTMTLLLKKG